MSVRKRVRSLVTKKKHIGVYGVFTEFAFFFSRTDTKSGTRSCLRRPPAKSKSPRGRSRTSTTSRYVYTHNTRRRLAIYMVYYACTRRVPLVIGFWLVFTAPLFRHGYCLRSAQPLLSLLLLSSSSLAAVGHKRTIIQWREKRIALGCVSHGPQGRIRLRISRHYTYPMCLITMMWGVFDVVCGFRKRNKSTDK